MNQMSTMHIEKEIQFSSGKIYGIRGKQRLPICSCLPLVMIYRLDNYMPILGHTDPDPKAYHIGIVFPESPEFVPGMDWATIESMSRFELRGEVLLFNQELREFEFRDLHQDDGYSEWALTTEEQVPLRELLGVEPF